MEMGAGEQTQIQNSLWLCVRINVNRTNGQIYCWQSLNGTSRYIIHNGFPPIVLSTFPTTCWSRLFFNFLMISPSQSMFNITWLISSSPSSDRLRYHTLMRDGNETMRTVQQLVWAVIRTSAEICWYSQSFMINMHGCQSKIRQCQVKEGNLGSWCRSNRLGTGLGLLNWCNVVKHGVLWILDVLSTPWYKVVTP